MLIRFTSVDGIPELIPVGKIVRVTTDKNKHTRIYIGDFSTYVVVKESPKEVADKLFIHDMSKLSLKVAMDKGFGEALEDHYKILRALYSEI